MLPATLAWANPQGQQVVRGNATFQSNGNTLTVTNTPGAAINWQSFSIQKNETTHFQQANSASSVLNRVVANNPSELLGNLTSNGKVVLINPFGITVGRGAAVDTAGFTASTLNITDADWANGKLRFKGNALSGDVKVDGVIRSPNGDVMLFAPNVSVGSEAIIKADNGNVIIGAGQKVEVTGRGLEGIRFEIQSADNKAVNLGRIEGNAVGVFAGTLRHSGSITAQTATMEGGKVVLRAIRDIEISGPGAVVKADGAAGKPGGQISISSATGDVLVGTGARITANGGTGAAGGTVSVAAEQGKLVAEQASVISANGSPAGSVRLYGATESRVAGVVTAASPVRADSATHIEPISLAVGGKVEVLGNEVKLQAGAQVDVSGDGGGGVILVGGDFQGRNPDVPNARNTEVAPGVTLTADGRAQGDGGKVIVWADNDAHFSGTISAKGGLFGGDGGFAETSGKKNLYYRGRTNLLAPRGRTGTLLLDPDSIVIMGGSQDGTDNPDGSASTLDNGSGLGTVAGGTGAFTIYESEIESTQANIYLMATNKISVSGNFTGGPNGELTIQPGYNLRMQVTNAITGTHGIDLTGSDAGANLVVRASYNGVTLTRGTISLETTSASSNGSIKVGSLVTDGGAVYVLAQGAVTIGQSGQGGIDTSSTTTLTGGGSVTIESKGAVNILSNIKTGTLAAIGGVIDITAQTGLTNGAINIYGTLSTNNNGINATGWSINTLSGSTAGQINAGLGGVSLVASGSSLGSFSGGVGIDFGTSVQGYTVAISADRFYLHSGSVGLTGTSNVAIAPFTAARGINIGGNDDLGTTFLGITQSENAKITTPLLRIGSIGNTGDIDVTSSFSRPGDTLSLITQGAIGQAVLNPITANKLMVSGSEAYLLSENTVTTFAGKATSAGLYFRNAGSFTVGAVDFLTLTSAGSTGQMVLQADAGASTITLASDVKTEGAKITFAADRIQVGNASVTSVTVDSNTTTVGSGGNIQFLGDITAAQSGRKLYVSADAGAAGANGGDVDLQGVTNINGAYLNLLDVASYGTGGLGKLSIYGSTLALGANGTGDANQATLSLRNAYLSIANSTATLNTNAGGGTLTSGGYLDLASTSLYADAAYRALSLKADAGTNGNGGTIRLGVVGNHGGSYLAGLSASAVGDGTGAMGEIQLLGNITTTSYLPTLSPSSGSVSLDANVILHNSVTIKTSVDTGATSAGSVHLGVNGDISANAAGRTLAVDTSGAAAGITGGNVFLGDAGNGGGAYLNGLTINAAGDTIGVVYLNASNLSLDAKGALASDQATLSIQNAHLWVNANVTLNTNMGGATLTSGGTIDLETARVGGTSSHATLVLKANGGADGDGGTIKIGEVAAYSDWLGGLTASALGNGTGAIGQIQLFGDISTTQSTLSPATGNIILDGNVVLHNSVSIVTSTETFAPGAGSVLIGTNGGNISAATPGLSLTINASPSNFSGTAAGDVSLPSFGNTGGSYVRTLAVTSSGYFLGTPSTVRLNGDILLDRGSALDGEEASLNISGGYLELIKPSGTLTIDTLQQTTGSGGAVTLSFNEINATSAGTVFSIDTSTPDNLNTRFGGDIAVNSRISSNGATVAYAPASVFLNSKAVSPATDGEIRLGGNILVGDNGEIDLRGSVVLAGGGGYVVLGTDSGTGSVNVTAAGSVDSNPFGDGYYALYVDGGAGGIINFSQAPIGSGTRVSEVEITGDQVTLGPVAAWGGISVLGHDYVTLQGDLLSKGAISVTATAGTLDIQGNVQSTGYDAYSPTSSYAGGNILLTSVSGNVSIANNVQIVSQGGIGFDQSDSSQNAGDGGVGGNVAVTAGQNLTLGDHVTIASRGGEGGSFTGATQTSAAGGMGGWGGGGGTVSVGAGAGTLTVGGTVKLGSFGGSGGAGAPGTNGADGSSTMNGENGYDGGSGGHGGSGGTVRVSAPKLVVLGTVVSEGGAGGAGGTGGAGGAGGAAVDLGDGSYISPGNGGDGGWGGYGGSGGNGGSVSLSTGSAGILDLNGATVSSIGGMPGAGGLGGQYGLAGDTLGISPPASDGMAGSDGIEGNSSTPGYIELNSKFGKGVSLVSTALVGRDVHIYASGGPGDVSLGVDSSIQAQDGAYVSVEGGKLLMHQSVTVDVTGNYSYNSLTLNSDQAVELAAVSGPNIYIHSPTITSATGFAGVNITGGYYASLGGGTVYSDVGSLAAPITVDVPQLHVQGSSQIWIEAVGDIELHGVSTNVASGAGTVSVHAGGMLNVFTGVAGNIGAGDAGVYLSGDDGLAIWGGASVEATGTGTVGLVAGSGYLDIMGSVSSGSGDITATSAGTVHLYYGTSLTSGTGRVLLSGPTVLIGGDIATGYSGTDPAVTLVADDLNFAGSITASAAGSTVAIKPLTPTRDITVRAGNDTMPGGLLLFVEDFEYITADTLQLGDGASSGDVTFDATWAATLFSAPGTLAVYGANITQESGYLHLEGMMAKATGGVTLDSSGNRIAAMAGAAGSAGFKLYTTPDGGTLTVGSVAGVNGITTAPGGNIDIESFGDIKVSKGIDAGTNAGSGTVALRSAWGGGTIYIDSSGSISGKNVGGVAVHLVADDLVMASVIDARSSALAINPYSASRKLNLGANEAGAFSLDTTEQSALLGLTDLYAGKTVSGASAFGAIQVGDYFAAASNLYLRGTGAVTQGAFAPLMINSLYVEGGSVNLASATNTLSQLGGKAASGAFSFKNDGELRITSDGVKATGGNVSLQSVNGAIVNDTVAQVIWSTSGTVTLLSAGGLGTNPSRLRVRAPGLLTANAGSGAAWLTSDNALSIGTIGSSAGANTIDITTTGASTNLTIAGASSGDDNWNLLASGDIVLDASGAIGGTSATLTAGIGSITTNAISGTSVGVTGLLKLNSTTIGSASNPIRFDAGEVSASVSSGGMYLLSVPAFDLADFTYTTPSSFTVSLASEGILTVGGYMYTGADALSSFSLASAAGIVFASGTAAPGTVAGLGTLNLNGPVTVQDDHNFQALVSHTGTWGITDGAAVQFQAAGNSLGAFSITDGSASFTSGSATAATLSIGAAGTLNLAGGNLSAGMVSSQSGLINLGNSSHTLAITSGGLNNQGTITGTGNINLGGGAGTLVNNATLMPGGDGTTGTIYVVGGLTQNTSGRMKMDWNGVSSYDHISVQGNFTSGGTLSVGEGGAPFITDADQFSAVYFGGTLSGSLPVMASRTTGLVFGSTSGSGPGGNLVVSPVSITNFWTGSGGDGDYLTSSNWSRLHTPTISEDAVVNVAGTNTITLGLAGTAKTLSFTGDEIFTLTGPSANLTLESGGTSTFGTFNFGSGARITSGGATVDVDGVMTITEGFHTLDGITLRHNNSSGSSAWQATSGSSWIDLQNGARFANTALGKMGISTAGSFTAIARSTGLTGTDVFNNNGTLNVNASGGAVSLGSTFQPMTTEIDGIVNVTAGRLALGGTNNTVNAYMTANAGTTLAVAGSGVNAAFSSTSKLLGSGLFRVEGGASATLGSGADTSLLAAGTLQLSSGSLRLDGTAPLSMANKVSLDIGTLDTAGALALNGGFDWVYGTVKGTGAVTVGGVLNMSGTSVQHVLDGRTLTLTDTSGTSAWNSGTLGFNWLSLNNGAEFGVGAGATLNIGGDGNFGMFDNGSVVFRNQGVIRKTGLSTFSAGANSATQFISTGTIDVQGGGFRLGAATNAVSGGSIHVASGAAFGTTLNRNFINTGIVSGSGTFDVGTGTLTNSGAIKPGGTGAAGTLTVSGNLDMGTGTLYTELFGQTTYDVLSVSGNLVKSGTIAVSEGSVFVAGGQTFDVVNFGGTLTGSTPLLTSFITDVGFGLTAPGNMLRLSADTVTNRWAVDAGGLWTSAAGWSRGHAPNQYEDAVIDRSLAAAVVTLNSAGAQARSLLVNGDDTLRIAGASASLSIGVGGGNLSNLVMVGGTLSGGAVTHTGTAGLSGSAVVQSSFTSTGTLNVDTTGVVFSGGGLLNGGTLNLPGGSGISFTNGSFDFLNATINANGDSFNVFNNAHVTLSGTTALGDVYLVIDGTTGTGGHLTLNNTGTNSIGDFYMHGANALLDGSAALAINGDFTWSGGTMAAGGTVTVNAGTDYYIHTGTASLLNRTLVNQSLLSIDGANGLTLGATGTLINDSGATLYLSPDGASVLSTASAGRLINDGTVEFNGQFAPSTTSAINAKLDNNGTLKVVDGTLVLAGTLTANAGVIDLVASTSELSTSNRSLLNDTTGSITGFGTLNMGSGTLTNNGNVNPGDASGAGVITITGNYVQGSNGTLSIDAASSSLSDKLQISGTAALAGTLNVGETGGYTIGFGDGYLAVTAASVGGTFTVVNGPMGMTLTPSYGASSVSLFTAGGPVNNWTGGGTLDDWSDPANWSLGRIPATGDVVIIDPAGVNTITLASAAAGGLYSLDFSKLGNDDIFLFSTGGSLSLPASATLNGTLHIAGGTLTSNSGAQTANMLRLTGGKFDNAAAFNVTNATLAGGTVAGAGAFNVSGMLDWTGGTFSGGTLATSGATTLASGTHTLSGAIWDNTGTVTHSGGHFSFVDGTFNNQSVFIVTGADSSLFESSTGTNIVNNSGTFNFSQTGVLTAGTLAQFNNTGIVNVNAGAVANVSGDGTDTGAWSVATGANLRFAGGTRSISGTGSVEGGGTLSIDAGDVTINSPTFGIAGSGTVESYGGNLFLNTGSAVSFVNSVFLWNGMLDTTDDVSFAALAVSTNAELAGTGNKTVSGLLTLTDGAITGGTLTTNGGATLNGSYQVLGGTRWNNASGTVTHSSGTLHLNNGSTLYNQSGAVINETGNGGTHAVAYTLSSGANGKIENAGTINWNATGSRSISGDVGLDNTGTINLTGGSLNMAGTAGFGQSGKLLLGTGTTFQRNPGFNNTGYIAGTGTIDVGSGTVTNMGTLSPGGGGAAGTLHVNGNLNISSGTLLAELAGTGSYDKVEVSANLATGGTVQVSELATFVGGGDAFNVVTYGGTLSAGAPVAVSNVADVSSFLISTGAGNFTLTADGVVNYWLDGITGNWASAGNWTRGHAPNAYEDVVINPAGKQTITVNSGAQAARVLSMPGDDRLVINGGSLSLGQPSTLGSLASVTLTAGSLGGAGSLTVDGTLLWTGGTLAMGAGLTTSGQSTLSGVAVQDLQGNWTNTGAIDFNGGNLQLNGANLDNLSGGVFNVNITDGFQDGISGSGTLTNQAGATFHVTGAATAFDVSVGSYFVNNGTTTIDASFLDLERGVTHQGSFAIASGAALRVRNNETTHVFGASSSISGAGYFEIFDNPAVSILGSFAPAETKISGGQLNFNGTGPYSLSALTMTGGTLGGGANVSVSGAFDWAGGTVAGASTLSTAGTVLVGTSSTLDGRVLDNSGFMSVGTGKQLVLQGAAQLKNQATGTLTVANPGALGIAAGAGGGSISNAGKFVLANSTIATGGGNFSNSGQLNAYGKLDLGSGTLVNTGTLSPGGASVVRTLAVTGNANLTGGTYVADLAGTASYDMLTVSGNLVQGGTVVASEMAPFIGGGDTFNVVTYGGTLTGTVPSLSAVIPDVTLTLGAGAGALTLTATSVTNRWVDSTSGDWSNGTKWTRGHTPNALEDVVINPLGTQTITVSSGAQLAKTLTMTDNDTLVVSGGALNLSQASTIGSSAAFSLTGGSVNAAGSLGVAGTFNWSGGTLGGAGTLATSGAVTLSGGDRTLSAKTWNIGAGTVTYTGGDFNLSGGTAAVNIASGAVFNFATTDSPLSDIQGQGTFTAGSGSTLNLNSTTGSNSIFTTTVNLLGTTNLLAGTFDVDRDAGGVTVNLGGAFNMANGTSMTGYTGNSGPAPTLNVNSGGVFNVTGGTATLNVNNWDLFFNTPTALPAALAVNQSGNTVTAGSALTVGGAYTLSGGTLTGAGNIALNGAFNWGGGTATGAGTLSSAAASTLGNTVALDGKIWKNSGSISIGSGATLLLKSGAQLSNLAAATLSVANTGGQGIGAGAGGGSISNAGLLDLNGSTIGTGGGNFSNSGTLVASGKLDLAGTGTFSNSGLLRIAGAGSTGTLTVTGNASLAGGTVEVDLAGPSNFDLLAVSGDLVQGGTLGVSENTVFIAGGNTFNVVTYGGALTGTAPAIIDSIADVGFTLNPGAGALQLVAASVSNSWLDLSGNWATGSNWSRGHTPNAFEDAYINPLGTQLVTLSSGAQAPRSLQLVGDDTLSITGGSLAIANASTVGSGASLLLSGGTLSGSGVLDVAGAFNWNGGTITAGAVNVAGVLTIGNTAIKELRGTLSHSNASGMSSWIGGDNGGGGVIDIIAGGRIINQAGAVLEIATGGQSNRVGAYGFSPVGFIDNYGTLDVTGGGMFAFSPSNSGNQQHQLRNFASGVVNVTDSHLYMHNDASAPIAQLGTWNFTGSSGTALLNLYGNNNWGAGATINTSGATSLAVNGPTQLYSGAAQTWSTVSLAGGSSLVVNQNFTVTDTMTWAGSVSGSGGAAMTLGSGANTAINGGAALSGANLVNNGTLSIGSGFTLSAGQLVTNAGLLTLGNGTLTAASGLANSGTVTGNGRLNTSGTVTNTGTITPGGAGTVGTISIAGNADLSGGTLNVELASPSSFDLLTVSGNLVQGGTINASETTPFISAGDFFDMVSFGGTVSGSAPVVNSSIVGVALATSTTAAASGALRLAPTSVTNYWLTGSGDWTDSAKWSRGHAPTNGEAVTVNPASGAETVTVSSGASGLASLVLGSDDSFLINGGNFILPVASTLGGTITLAGGTLTNSGAALSVSSLDWQSGYLGGAGSIAGVLTFSGSGSRTLTGPTLTSMGGTTLSGGSLLLEGGAFGWSSGTLTVAGGATLGINGGAIDARPLLNQGMVAVGSLASALTALDASGTQTGQFDIAPGKTLSLGTGSVTLASGAGIHGGTWAINAGQVSIAGTLDRGAGATTELSGGTLSVAGALTTASLSISGGLLDGTGDLTVTDSFSNVAGSLGASFDEVRITQQNGDLSIAGLGAASVTLASLTGGILDGNAGGTNITAGNVKLSAATGIDLDLNTPLLEASLSGAGTMDVSNTGALELAAITAASGSANFTVGGPLTQSGAVQVLGPVTIGTGGAGVTLNHAGNQFDGTITLLGTGATTIVDTSGLSVTGSAASLSLDSQDVSVGSLTVSGPLTIVATGQISQGAAISVTGLTRLSASTILMPTASSYAGGVTFNAGGGVTLASSGALVLGGTANHAGGTLSLTAAGPVSQTSVLTVAGAASVSAPGQTVDFGSLANDFTSVSFDAGSVLVNDASSIAIGGSVAGNVAVTAATGVNSYGSLNFGSLDITLTGTGSANLLNSDVSGATSFATSGGGSYQNINYVNNSTSGSIGGSILATGTVSLAFKNTGLALPQIQAGTLSVASGGALTQTGAFTATTTGLYAEGFDITLNNGANQMGALTVKANNASITDAGALNIDGEIVGALQISAAALTQTPSSVLRTGSATLSGSTGISLEGENELGALAAISGGAISVNDVGASLTLGPVSTPAALSLQSGGAVLQSAGATLSSGSVEMVALSIGTPGQPLNFSAPVATLYGVDGGVHAQSGQAFTLAGLVAAGDASVSSAQALSVMGEAFAEGSLSLAGQGMTVHGNVTGHSVSLNSGSGTLAIGGGMPGGVFGATSVALAGHDILLQGGSAQGAKAQVISEGGISINAAGNFILRGGAGTGALAEVTSFGPLSVTVAGTLEVTGGDGAGAYARLDPAASSLLSVNAQSVTLQGGTAPGAYAAIVSEGDITVVAPGGISMAAGTQSDTDAVVVSYFGKVTLPSCNGCVKLTVSPFGNGTADVGVLGGEDYLSFLTDNLVNSNELVQIQQLLTQLAEPDDPGAKARKKKPEDIVVEGQVCQ